MDIEAEVIYTKARYARAVADIARYAASETASLAEGMWNPLFCSSDATPHAVVFIEDIRRRLDWIETGLAVAKDQVE